MALLPPKSRDARLQIDLAGPQGNAFFLMGTANSLAAAHGYDDDQKKQMLDDMKSSDYLHLIKTFDKHFGEDVDLLLPPGMSLTESEKPAKAASVKP